MIRAVVFDFFGTLSDPRAESDRQVLYQATGRALGVEPAGFGTRAFPTASPAAWATPAAR